MINLLSFAIGAGIPASMLLYLNYIVTCGFNDPGLVVKEGLFMFVWMFAAMIGNALCSGVDYVVEHGRYVRRPNGAGFYFYSRIGGFLLMCLSIPMLIFSFWDAAHGDIEIPYCASFILSRIFYTMCLEIIGIVVCAITSGADLGRGDMGSRTLDFMDSMVPPSYGDPGYGTYAENCWLDDAKNGMSSDESSWVL